MIHHKWQTLLPQRVLLSVESDSNIVLAIWSEELDAAPRNFGNGIAQGQSKTCAKKHVSSTPKESTEPISGIKDPTKSLKSDASLPKTGGKTSADGPKPPKKASTVKKAGSSSKGKSAPKECLSRSQQSPALTQSSTTDVAAVLKEAFSGLAMQKNKGFSGLGKLLKAQNDAKSNEHSSVLFDSELDDSSGG